MSSTGSGNNDTATTTSTSAESTTSEAAPQYFNKPSVDVDLAREPRSCMAAMISRAVNMQARNRPHLNQSQSFTVNPAAQTAASNTLPSGSRQSMAVLKSIVKDRDEDGLWLPDFTEKTSVKVEGFFSGVDYAPRVFESLRQHFGISSGQFAADMGRLGEGKEGEGKSKQLFFQVHLL